MRKRYGQACPVAKSLEVIGDRWTLLLVRDLLPGPRRFADFARSLKGIAPNILSDRLKLMEAHGLLARRFYSDHPPRAAYALTDRGRDLGVVVGALASWGARHVHRASALVHDACGHPVEMRYFCGRCATRVGGSTVRIARVGPGARPSVRGDARSGARAAGGLRGRRAPRGRRSPPPRPRREGRG